MRQVANMKQRGMRESSYYGDIPRIPYQLSESLISPKEINERTPTFSTYTTEQAQEEFIFQLSFHTLDLLWYVFENNCNLEEVSHVIEKSVDEINPVFANFKPNK